MVEPVRTCVGCRQRADQSTLIRLVVSIGTVAVKVDASRTAPGRGVYVHPDPGCHQLALKRRAIGRALRTPGADARQIEDELRSVCPDPGPIA